MEQIQVLIIDDEKICVEELIQTVGWATLGIGTECVHRAYSVRQAQNFLKSNSVHIVICDIEMPNGNGLDFIEWLTEWARFAEEPVECIMLTCHPEYEYIRRALQLGCLDYVLKPMDPEEMEAVIKKAVEKVREREKRFLREARVAKEQVQPNLVYQRIIPYIEEHLTESISVDTIAEYVALNPHYMMRLFKKETGESILGYITAERIELAKEMLLKTDWPIELISEKSGYFSVTHFGNMFKRREGMTPGQYRKEHR